MLSKQDVITVLCLESLISPLPNISRKHFSTSDIASSHLLPPLASSSCSRLSITSRLASGSVLTLARRASILVSKAVNWFSMAAAVLSPLA